MPEEVNFNNQDKPTWCQCQRR